MTRGSSSPGSCARVSLDSLRRRREEAELSAPKEESCSSRLRSSETSRTPPTLRYSDCRDLGHLLRTAESPGGRLAALPGCAKLRRSPPPWDRPCGDRRTMSRWVAAWVLLGFGFGAPPFAKGEEAGGGGAGDRREGSSRRVKGEQRPGAFPGPVGKVIAKSAEKVN